MGFSIDLHFCQGNLKSIALLSSTGSCHESPNAKCSKHLPNETLSAEAEAECCQNNRIFLQNDDDQQVVQQQAILKDISSVDWIMASLMTVQTSSVQVYNPAKYKHYRPPLIPRDRYVLFETFLI